MAVPDPDPLWITIPVKRFAEGKSRIALSPRARVALNRRLLSHVLGVACATIPAARIVLVSHDPGALAAARAAGAWALDETGDGGLNAALGAAATFAAARGACAILSLFADLPFCTPDDLAAMIAQAGDDRIVIAPDEGGTGSNALLMAPGAIAYRHGAGSFGAHAMAARAAGLRLAVVSRPGLRRDVDRAADLALLSATESGLDK